MRTEKDIETDQRLNVSASKGRRWLAGGGYVGAGSPDHADAAIWGITEVMLDFEPVANIRFFNIHR